MRFELELNDGGKREKKGTKRIPIHILDSGSRITLMLPVQQIRRRIDVGVFVVSICRANLSIGTTQAL